MGTKSTVQTRLPRHHIDPHAMQIVSTLQDAGFTTYLVGGCVRDLLLGRSPKDFDIATLATPRDISRLFRNCRIIGRRFRLAHIHFGTEIFEVATFRGQSAEAVSNPWEKGDAFIERTNTFGTPRQDASSRDFTMNGLFYDPVAEELIDYVEGRKDIEGHMVRTIGAPAARMEEDPVRILRAIKFSARLGFDIEEQLQEAMRENVMRILHCPVPRVTEELFRLAEGGAASTSYALLHSFQVLDVLLPELNEYLNGCSDDEWSRYFTTLVWLDRLGKAHGTLPREFVLACLFLWPVMDMFLNGDAGGDWGNRTEDWFQERGVALQIPVRFRLRFYLMMAMLQRMLYPKTAQRFRRVRPLLRQSTFPQALALFRVVVAVTGQSRERYNWWREQADENGISAAPFPTPKEKGAKEDTRERSEGPRPRRRSSSGRRGHRRRG